MAICTLSPTPKQYFWDPTTGLPLANGFVYTYSAGTSTPATTYQDSAGASANTNPIQLNGFGWATIYLPIAMSFKFVVKNASGVEVYTQDNISAVPPSSANLDISGTFGEAVAAGAPVYLSDGSGGKNAGQWYNAANTSDYSSTTPDVGFAVTDVGAGSSGSIRIGGRLTGLAGLLVGALYYIGAAGTITTAPGVLARLVGQADTSSTLVIEIGPSRSGLPTVDNTINGFRLTLTSGTPFTTADVTAATTVYACPYRGNRIALFDANGNANLYTSAEFSIALPAVANQMYDVFCYQSAGVPTLELLAWTNATTRATALVTNVAVGVQTKSGDATRRFLGSVSTTAVAGQTEDSVSNRLLSNGYHRGPRRFERFETNTTWTWNSNTIRQANGSAANQVTAVICLTEVRMDLDLLVAADIDVAGNIAEVGIGVDSTTTFASNQAGIIGQAHANTSIIVLATHYSAYPAIGLHVYSWNEAVQTGTTTFWAANNGSSRVVSGMVGWIDG